MARVSKTSTEKENRVKKVCESGRPSKRGNSSSDESDKTAKKVELTSCSSSTDSKKYKEKQTEKKSPSKTEKHKAYFKRRQERESYRNRRARSPSNSRSGSRHSSFKRSREVTRKNNASKAYQSRTESYRKDKQNGSIFSRVDFKKYKEKRTENKSPSRTEKHKSSFERRQERESYGNKRTRSPSNSEFQKTSKFQKTSEVPRKQKESNGTESSRSNSKDRSSRSTDSSRHSSGRRATSPEPIAQNSDMYKKVDSLKEFMPATITRNILATLLYSPFFNSTVIGCYVRLSEESADGLQLKYVVWKIVGVEELDVVYEVDRKPTNKCIMCQRGSEERLFRIKFVSNSDIQPVQFVDWLICNRASGTVPTLEKIERKRVALQNALTHRYAKDEIQQMIKAKKQLQSELDKYAFNKEELYKRKELASQSGDFQDAKHIQKKIDELDNAVNKKDTKASDVAKSSAKMTATKPVKFSSFQNLNLENGNNKLKKVDVNTKVNVDKNSGMEVDECLTDSKTRIAPRS